MGSSRVDPSGWGTRRNGWWVAFVFNIVLRCSGSVSGGCPSNRYRIFSETFGGICLYSRTFVLHAPQTGTKFSNGFSRSNGMACIDRHSYPQMQQCPSACAITACCLSRHTGSRDHQSSVVMGHSAILGLSLDHVIGDQEAGRSSRCGLFSCPRSIPSRLPLTKTLSPITFPDTYPQRMLSNPQFHEVSTPANDPERSELPFRRRPPAALPRVRCARGRG